jgi:hypothetical protein
VEEDLQIHPRYSSLLETQRLCKEAIQWKRTEEVNLCRQATWPIRHCCRWGVCCLIHTHHPVAAHVLSLTQEAQIGRFLNSSKAHSFQESLQTLWNLVFWFYCILMVLLTNFICIYWQQCKRNGNLKNTT